jgi:hypothetical protein
MLQHRQKARGHRGMPKCPDYVDRLFFSARFSSMARETVRRENYAPATLLTLFIDLPAGVSRPDVDGWYPVRRVNLAQYLQCVRHLRVVTRFRLDSRFGEQLLWPAFFNVGRWMQQVYDFGAGHCPDVLAGHQRLGWLNMGNPPAVGLGPCRNTEMPSNKIRVDHRAVDPQTNCIS